jgi:hypothetical protein
MSERKKKWDLEGRFVGRKRDNTIALKNTAFVGYAGTKILEIRKKFPKNAPDIEEHIYDLCIMKVPKEEILQFASVVEAIIETLLETKDSNDENGTKTISPSRKAK